MITNEEIRAEWKNIRSSLGKLLCCIDGKLDRLQTLDEAYDEEAFGEVVWSEADIENAFEQLDYKMTPERRIAVLNKVKPVIEDAMTSLGWSIIYDAVDEVCKDKDDCCCMMRR